MNLLEVKNICKTYGSGETAVKALKDVSFSVPKGEYVAVVGESGSGKSTLLNMIGALDTPTTGKVLIDGKDIFAMDERKLTVFRRRNIGFIFQAFNLVPELTVEQNIIVPGAAGLPKAGQGISGRTADRAESERPSEASAKPAFRWAAATGSHWPRPDDPPFTDFGG
jgi:L_ocin_972_ABC: putative bacteriocin export ABC transporter, lactococcin 972 group